MSGSPPHARKILNAMTVDVEEHFQVSGFENVVSRDEWDSLPSRVEASTNRLLDLFDESGVRATFFVLGWIGKRHPGLVRRIAERGHEVASHGYSHRLIYDLDAHRFRDETIVSRQILQDASGQPVVGYRSASFSIGRGNAWALDVLAEAGFDFDSSLFPVVHDRYGVPSAPRKIYQIKTLNGMTLVEVPPSTIAVGKMTLPVAGGGYLRSYPAAFTRWAVGRLNSSEGIPAIVYVHPWEIDPNQPRIPAPLLRRLRHRFGIGTTMGKLRDLMSRYPFGTISQVISQVDRSELACHEAERLLSDGSSFGNSA